MRIPVGKYWVLLSRYLRPQWRWVAVLSVSMFSSIAVQLANPQIMRRFIDTATSGGDVRALAQAGVAFLALALAGQGLAVANTYLGQNVAWTATNAMRLDLTEHVLRLDQSFHKAHTPGELIERIDGDVNTLASFFSQFAIQLVGSGILLVGIMALLVREHPVVGLGVAVITAVTLAALIKVRAMAVPYWKKEREQQAEFYGFLGERLGGTADIRANGATGYVMQRFYELTRRRFMPSLKAGVAGYSMWLTGSVGSSIRRAVALLLIYYAWQQDALTIGGAYLVFHYTDLLWLPISQIRQQATELQRAEAGMQRIEELQDTATKLPAGSSVLPPGPLPLEFEGVSFGYEDGDGEMVLRSIDLHLEPGRVLGVLGRTGSGKTTLARLLLRLYDPTEGQIRLGGVPSHTVDLLDARQRVGMVTQDVQLFQATVRDNLTFFDQSISDDRLGAVLEDLEMGEWLASLPNGLDTMLEAGGGGLSAGQGQLLAFARVFLRDPGLVILDEASSRLDPATETLIERAVSKLLAGRTGIVIAHRLGTVERADEILILEDGRVLEMGDRAALAADPDSRFHHLLLTGMQEVLA